MSIEIGKKRGLETGDIASASTMSDIKPFRAGPSTFRDIAIQTETVVMLPLMVPGACLTIRMLQESLMNSGLAMDVALLRMLGMRQSPAPIATIPRTVLYHPPSVVVKQASTITTQTTATPLSSLGTGASVANIPIRPTVISPSQSHSQSQTSPQLISLRPTVTTTTAATSASLPTTKPTNGASASVVTKRSVTNPLLPKPKIPAKRPSLTEEEVRELLESSEGEPSSEDSEDEFVDTSRASSHIASEPEKPEREISGSYYWQAEGEVAGMPPFSCVSMLNANKSDSMHSVKSRFEAGSSVIRIYAFGEAPAKNMSLFVPMKSSTEFHWVDGFSAAVESTPPAKKLKTDERKEIKEKKKEKKEKKERTVARGGTKKGKLLTILRDPKGEVIMPQEFNSFTVHSLGRIVPGYHSDRYFFPVGFKSEKRIKFKESKIAVQFVSEIFDKFGSPWFRVTATKLDEYGEPLEEGHIEEAISSTAAAEQTLARFRSSKSGTKESGPYFFGLANSTIYYLISKLPGAEKIRLQTQVYEFD